MDVNTALQKMLKTGTLEYGYKKGIKNIVSGKAKAVILAKQGPRKLQDNVRKYALTAGVPVIEYTGNSLELGRTCGKPFLVSTITIVNPGEVSIKEVTK